MHAHALRAVVLHQAVAPDAPLDEQDVLTAAASVGAALGTLGWRAWSLPVTLDLAAAARMLRQLEPDLVFNLVECLPGAGPGGALASAVPALLAELGLHFTGADAATMALTADKPATRRTLRAAGITVPPAAADGWPGPFIVKHATEHASFGLDAGSVVETLPCRIAPGWFAEAFLPGREFNLALLAGQGGEPELLPIAELIYAEDWPAGLPRILDYAGKWDTAHPRFARTTRAFGTASAELAGLLGHIARHCWRLLGLAGYARIDLRLDAGGVPHVLDVNANPCLAEAAGFAAAAAAAGLSYAELVRRIAEAAGPPPPIPASAGAPRSRKVAAVALRETLLAADVAAVAGLCRASGFFSPGEVAVAEELARDRLTGGAASDYRFVLAEPPHGMLLGFACYGRTPCTSDAWDLYWIVVHPAAQGGGVGRHMLARVFDRVAAAGGGRLYAETSGRAQYAPTRAFYAATGFHLQAVVPDFYAEDDAKLIWLRRVRAGSAALISRPPGRTVAPNGEDCSPCRGEGR